MNEQFTPGPWSILFNDKTKVVLEKSGVAIFVADTYAGFTKSDSEQEANAKLISAAPEMYEFGKTTAEVLQILLERLGPKPSGLNAEIKRLAEERISEWEKIENKTRGRK